MIERPEIKSKKRKEGWVLDNLLSQLPHFKSNIDSRFGILENNSEGSKNTDINTFKSKLAN